MRKWIVGFGILIVLATLLLIIDSWLHSTPEPVPSPNGYDDFLKIAASIQTPPDPATASRAELEAAVEQNRDAIDAVQEAVQKESRVPIANSEAYLSQHMGEIGSLKSLSRLLAAAGKLAEMDGQTNHAAQIYLDLARFGGQVRRGGLMIDGLVGIAIETQALNGLEQIRPGLDAATSGKAVETLKRIEAECDGAATIIEREQRWARRTFGIRYAMARIVNLFRSGALDAATSTFETKMGNLDAQRTGITQALSRQAPPT